MGYSVYYEISPKVSKKAYNAALEKINSMIYQYTQDNRGSMYSLSGYSAHSKTYSGVQFNGARDEACEPFCLPKYENLKEFFDRGAWTKTNRRLYTPAVIATCLLLRKELKKNFKVRTDDGELENDEFYEQGVTLLLQYHRWAEK